jgi:glutathione synthase/RimK-type ligase-like ATP-grasp enzyme
VPNVGFLTSAEIPQLTADDRLAVPLLEERGVRVQPIVWTDESVDPASLDLVVIRSTWDWYRSAKRYAARLQAIESRTRVLNSRAWEWLDKRYLLERLGRTRVPTTYVVESPAQLEASLARCPGRLAVIKPATAAAGHRTVRFEVSDRTTAYCALDAILRDDVALVQPFFEEVEADGEWSLLFFEGRFSHALKKRPRHGEFRIHEEYGGTIERATPSADIIDAASSALVSAGQATLYARVDGIVIPALGGFCVTELELVEPELFLRLEPEAPRRFAEAILRVL